VSGLLAQLAPFFLDVLLIRRLRIENLQYGQQYQFIAGSGLAVDSTPAT